MEKVSQAPDRLARHSSGIGFKTTAPIAHSIGRQFELRAPAGIEHVLQELTDKGHGSYPREELVQATTKVLEVPAAIVESALGQVLREGWAVAPPCQDDSVLIYSAGLNAAEQRLATDLLALPQGTHPGPGIQVQIGNNRSGVLHPFSHRTKPRSNGLLWSG